jgi:acyl-CoA synthetase (AMP-forming)/AMP-acid ligase II
MLGSGQEFKSPLGHSLTPVFLQVRSPGCLAVRASEALVRPARLTQALRHNLRQTVEDLPQTASGKIREFVLRERYLTSVAG